MPTTAHASSPIGGFELNGDPSLTSASTTGVFKSGTVTMPVLGSPLTLGCSAGSATGTFTGGSSPAPNPYLSFSTLNMACDSWYAGATVATDLVCPVNVTWDANNKVTSSKTDVVTGTLNVPTRCVKVTMVTAGIPCTVYIDGFTPAAFDENKKVVGSTTYNELTLSGSGLTVASASLACLGMVSAGQSITMNNFTFAFSGNHNFIP